MKTYLNPIAELAGRNGLLILSERCVNLNLTDETAQCSYANLQGPVGLCKFSYSWRDLKGTKFHQARGSSFSTEGYGPGDTLGFFIDLPVTEPRRLPKPASKEYLVVYKGHNYYEEQGADKVSSLGIT